MRQLQPGMVMAVAIIGTLLLIAILLLASFAQARYYGSRVANSIEADLRRELPIGASEEAIKAWFYSRNIPYEYIPPSPYPLGDRNDEPRYQARIDRVHSTLLVKANIYVMVYVDENRRVSDYEVRVRYEG